MNILDFKNKKIKGEKITVLTCYDYTSARMINKSNIDAILVGDSLAMTMYGEKSTIPATISLMAQHTRAVVRGAPDKFIIADMPFLSYRKSLSENMDAVLELMQTGAHAIKLEGSLGNEQLVEHLVQSGVPVMGHLGLTPQSINQLGGFKVQGRDSNHAQLISDQCLNLEKSGCFSVVLECVPSALAEKISQKLKIPTIGIGAGPNTDGQVLVWQDLLGLNSDFKPKFVRKYLDGELLITSALNNFAADVKSKNFPSIEESYE
ncbi:MAG: 3-methyl-2-oxobutanoate hydroxymethyltransferase [Bdellovibrionales bacterium]